MFTSTPVALKGSSNPRDKSSEATKTVLTVQYPSKTLNKTLSGSYQAIGKALAHGVPSQIANAVMKNPTIKNHIIENTLKTLSKEVESLCSRKSSKEDLAKFDFQLLCNEWRQRAPLFFSFLMTSAVNKRTKEYSWFSSVAIAGSVLLKQRSEKMDATASVLGILLKSKSVEASESTIGRFDKMKLTNANFSILRKLDELGENHDAAIACPGKTTCFKSKQHVSNQNKDLKTAQEKCDAVLLTHASHTHCSLESQKDVCNNVFQVPLGLIFKNENVNEDMLGILQQFHGYLPQTHNGGVDGQLFSGDQLIVERAVNMISSVANGYTPKDRLEGINLQLGDWHAAVKLFSLIYARFYNGKSATDSCRKTKMLLEMYSHHTGQTETS
ncbi:unnamed protein product [Porites lobata]|uniref:DUF6589 domain-containing protein n=1 Tax=Porites lobata TaxID=104759 RepID=A0ABN8QQH7_9CNID|nr:unnamed protein product [Porites lobata]